MEERRNQLRITEMLSRAFNLCKTNILEISKIVGIFIIPAMIIPIIVFATLAMTVFFSISIYSGSNLERMFGALGVGSILLIIVLIALATVVSLFGTLIITKILDDANKGNQVSWKSATGYVWNKIWNIIGLNLLVWLILFGTLFTVIVLSGVLIIVTFGIGAIIAIPFLVAVIVMVIPLSSLFNSMFIVNELGITDSIKETFRLFKRGHFLATIGKLSAISGIYIGVSVVLGIFQVVPVIGFIVTILGRIIMSVYTICYLNIFVLDRMRPNNNLFGDNFIDPII